MIRKYELGAEHSRGGDTDWFDLVFEDGNMFVRIVRDFGQPSKCDRTRDVLPADFDRHLLNGEPLRTVVIKKLNAILPVPAKSAYSMEPK